MGWCNTGSTWGNTLTAMGGMKKPRKKNNDMIAFMLGAGIVKRPQKEIQLINIL
jgi:hypothetical protein